MSPPPPPPPRWRFDKEGTCTLIPQIGKGDTSSRACATALPCAVHQNMLWVWPTPLAAGETPPSRDLIPGIPGEEGDTLGRVWMRDFENDYPLLLENILDPDHAEFAHASPLIFKDFTFLPDQPRRQITKKFFPVQGKPTTISNPSMATIKKPWKPLPNAATVPPCSYPLHSLPPFCIYPVPPASTWYRVFPSPRDRELRCLCRRIEMPNSVSCLVAADGSDTPSEVPCQVEFSQAYKDTDTDVSITWKAPCYVEWRRPPGHPMAGVFGFWVVPTGVGRSRFFIRTVPGFSKKVPDWLYHTFMNNFTDQDSGLLAAQGPLMMGAEAANPGAKGLRRESYTVRSQSDQVLQAVGSFLDATLGDVPNRSKFLGAIGGATELAESLPSIPGVSGGKRSTVLDRRSTHVDNCVACQTAVKRFTAIAKLLSAAAAFCGVAALMLSAALVGSTAASLTTAAAATPGLMEVIKAVHVHKGILAAAVLAAAAATACLVGAAKARDMLQNITGYVYPRSKIQKDLQKVPGVRQSPIDLKAPIPSSE